MDQFFFLKAKWLLRKQNPCLVLFSPKCILDQIIGWPHLWSLHSLIENRVKTCQSRQRILQHFARLDISQYFDFNMIVSNRSPISYLHVLCIWRKLQESLPKSIEKWLNSAWACQGIAKLERIQSLAIKSVKTSREPPFLPSTHCWVESKNHQLNYPSLMLRWPRWNWYVTILGSEIYNDDVLTFTCYHFMIGEL